MEGEKKKEKKETFTWKFMFFYTALFIYVRKICIFLIPDFCGGSDGKNLPVMWKTWVLSLGRTDPLEKKMAMHSSLLA